MAKLLVVTADGGGNLAVTLPIVAELQRRGHAIHVLFRPLLPGAPVPAAAAARAAKSGATVVDVPSESWAPGPTRPAVSIDEIYSQFTTLQMYARSAPLFVSVARTVAEVLRRDSFDAVVVDGHHAPTVAADAAGLPSVLLVSNISWSRLLPGIPVPGRGTLPTAFDPDDEAVAAQHFQAGLDELVLPHLNDARQALGVPPTDSFRVQQDALLQLIAASPAFDYVPVDCPSNTRWTGVVRAETDAPETWTSPWPTGDRRPLVVMSPTTTFMATHQVPFVQAAVDTMSRLPVRGLVTLGPSLQTSLVTARGDVAVVGHVSHAEIVPAAAAVITHAGHGTTMTALRSGVPLVCAPHFADQPDVAARVVARGVGLRVPHPPSVDELTDALTRVLDEPAYRSAALQIAEQLRTEDGAVVAGDEIERALQSTT